MYTVSRSTTLHKVDSLSVCGHDDCVSLTAHHTYTVGENDRQADEIVLSLTTSAIPEIKELLRELKKLIN